MLLLKRSRCPWTRCPCSMTPGVTSSEARSIQIAMAPLAQMVQQSGSPCVARMRSCRYLVGRTPRVLRGRCMRVPHRAVRALPDAEARMMLWPLLTCLVGRRHLAKFIRQDVPWVGLAAGVRQRPGLLGAREMTPERSPSAGARKPPSGPRQRFTLHLNRATKPPRSEAEGAWFTESQNGAELWLGAGPASKYTALPARVRQRPPPPDPSHGPGQARPPRHGPGGRRPPGPAAEAPRKALWQPRPRGPHATGGRAISSRPSEPPASARNMKRNAARRACCGVRAHGRPPHAVAHGRHAGGAQHVYAGVRRQHELRHPRSSSAWASTRRSA